MDSSQPLIGSSSANEKASMMMFLCIGIAAMGSYNFGMVLGFSSPTIIANDRSGNHTNASTATLCPINEHSFNGTNFDKLNCQLQMSSSDIAWFNGIFNLGAGAGAVLLGGLVGVIGKRFSMSLAAALFSVGWVLMLVVPKPTTPWNGVESSDPKSQTITVMLLASRAIIGLGIGLVCCSVSTYLTEIAPKTMRGAVGTVFQVGVVLGIFTAFLVGALIPWKTLAILSLALTGSACVLALFVPETPTWLVTKGKDDSARGSLKRLRNTRSGASVDDMMNEVYASAQGSGDEAGGGLSELFGDATARKALGISLGLMVVQQFCGINAVMLYAGIIFESVTPSVETANHLGTGVQGVQVAVTLASVWFMDRAGRVPILLWACTGQFICSAVLGAYFLVEMPAAIAVVALYGYILFFSSGMGAIPWSIMGEIFHPRVMAPASAIATAVNWTLSFVISYSVLPITSALQTTFSAKFVELHPHAGQGALFFIYSCVSLIGIVFIKAKVPETKNKSLSQIQAELRGEAGTGYEKIN